MENKRTTLVQFAIEQINNSIKDDETIFYDIVSELGLEVLEVANLLSSKEITFSEFILVHGAYKKVLSARKEETLEKGKTI